MIYTFIDDTDGLPWDVVDDERINDDPDVTTAEIEEQPF